MSHVSDQHEEKPVEGLRVVQFIGRLHDTRRYLRIQNVQARCRFRLLALTSIALFVVSFWANEPWQSLLINLTAGLLGGIITVLFVEKVIRWKEREEWAKFLGHVGNQANILANGVSSSIRLALDLPLPRPENESDVAHNPHLMREMMINLIENELLPTIGFPGSLR